MSVAVASATAQAMKSRGHVTSHDFRDMNETGRKRRDRLRDRRQK